MTDRVLKCSDRGCNLDFVFTAGEQEFYASRGFSEPRRCPGCRAKRKAMQAQNAPSPAPAAPSEPFWGRERSYGGERYEDNEEDGRKRRGRRR